MSRGPLSENDHPPVPVNARRTARRALLGILGLAILVFSTLALAEQMEGNQPDSLDSP